MKLPGGLAVTDYRNQHKGPSHFVNEPERLVSPQRLVRLERQARLAATLNESPVPQNDGGSRIVQAKAERRKLAQTTRDDQRRRQAHQTASQVTAGHLLRTERTCSWGVNPVSWQEVEQPPNFVESIFSGVKVHKTPPATPEAPPKPQGWSVQWNPREARPLHIALSEWADFIVVAPLSASSLSRWVNGLSEGLAASILLAAEKPVIAAAAMNTAMWCNQAIKKNWAALENFSNVITLSPSEGLLACDRIGDGRMASPQLIQLAIESASVSSQNNFLLPKDWKGLKLLVTAGATIEDIDSARYITNRSTGMPHTKGIVVTLGALGKT